MAAKRKVVSGVQNDLQTRINQSGGIQPGAHPEFEQPTPLEKAGAAVGKVFQFFQPKRKTVPGASPTTVRSK